MAVPNASQPRWFTPKRMLLIFCVVNLLTYIDRGTIASNGVNGSGLQGDFDLSNFEDGLLSSAFQVGLLITSPIFAHLARECNPLKLIAVGLSIWTFATAACGFSLEFWTIAIARMLVGVGEASFLSLAAPFVVDNAPHDKKAAWLSLFYMCVPVGVALGYVYGGMVGSYLHWRVAFWGEAILMLPFAIFCCISRPILAIGQVDGKPEDEHLHGVSKSNAKEDMRGKLKAFGQQAKIFLTDVKTLFESRMYTLNVLGYTVFNFVLGAFTYWGPKAVSEIFDMQNADLVFGCVAIICGIFGVLAGGFVLDRIGASVPSSFKLLAIATFFGAVFWFASFLSRTLLLFIPLLGVGELFILATQAPVNFVSLESVPMELRPLAMALSMVCIHVFGDVPSSPFVGLVQDRLDNWRTTSLTLSAILFLASFIWSLGCLLPVQSQIQDGGTMQPTQLEDSQEAPLLAQA